MAIDDNTSYELTGAQVKDLANKIKGKAADNTFVGATPAAPGSKGLVPEPQAGDGTKFLSGDGTWQTAPTVNNGALTIQQNGTTLDTFTANSSDDKTVNIQTITAETVAPAEDVGVITSSMIDWTTMPGSYSTTEQKTPFTWVDGKVICKKTVFIASYPNTTEKAVAHGITNLKQVIKLSGFMAISNGGAWPIPMPPNPLSSIETGITAFADQTNIVIRTGSDRSPYSGYITLWYTKTTD